MLASDPETALTIKAPGRRARRGLRKGGCKARVRIAEKPGGDWEVASCDDEHNHTARHARVGPVPIDDLIEMRAQVLRKRKRVVGVGAI